MHRSFRWSIRGIGIAGVAVSALWLIQLFLLPVIVRHEVRSAIAAMGLKNAKFEVASASLWGTTLNDVETGELRADSIDARFNPLSIIRGRLTLVRIYGASATFDLNQPKRAAVDSSSETSPAMKDLPIDQIEVRTSTLRLKTNGREWTFPLDGSLATRHMRLTTSVHDWPLTLDADVDAQWLPQHVVVTLGRGALAGSGSEIRWQSASLDAKLSMSATGDAMSIQLLPGSTLALNGAAGPNLRIGDSVFDVGGRFDRREMTLLNDILATRNIPAIAPPATPMTLRLTAAAKSPVGFEGIQATGSLGSASLNAIAGFGGASDTFTAHGRLKFDKTNVKAPGAKLELNDCSGNVPIAWNIVTPAAPGTISIGDVNLNGKNVAPFSASAAMTNNTLAIDGSWPIEEGKTLSAAPGVEISGTFGLRTHLTFGGADGFAPQVTFSADNAKIVAKDWDAEFDGIATNVAVESFSLPSTAASQVITMKHARMGKLDVSDGRIQFRVENPSSIFIEEASFGWAGGKLYSHAFRLNPTKADVDLVAYADGLNLDELLKVLTNGSASGAGTLYGKLPVSIRWPRVTFGDGFLYATPGTGRLTLADNVSVVESLMDQSDPRFAKDDTLKQVKSMMLESLRDFDYKVLKVEFKTGAGGLVASISAEGKGRSRPNLPEIVPTLNITGLDQLLNKVLVVKRAISAMGQSQGAAR